MAPVLMYRDPSDGTYKPLVVPGGGGGEGADEVVISDTEPADPAIELWLDTSLDDPGGSGWEPFDARYTQFAYVDQEITISNAAPTGTPARDGLLWVVVP